MTRDEAIAELFGAPLEDYIGERKRLAGELRSAGERAAAAEVGKLAKPSPAAWALNHVAREVPDAVTAWLASAATLRHASTNSAQVGGDALRVAMAEHRAATAKLRGVVREVSRPGGKALTEPMLDRVAALLQVATADEEAAERLRLGLVHEDKTAAPRIAAPSTPPPPASSLSRVGDAEASRSRRELEEEAAAAATRKAQAERRAALEARASELREALGTDREALEARKADHRAAVRRLEEARRAVRRGESEVGAAETAVTEAEDDIAAHERELAEVREGLRA